MRLFLKYIYYFFNGHFPFKLKKGTMVHNYNQDTSNDDMKLIHKDPSTAKSVKLCLELFGGRGLNLFTHIPNKNN